MPQYGKYGNILSLWQKFSEIKCFTQLLLKSWFHEIFLVVMRENFSFSLVKQNGLTEICTIGIAIYETIYQF